MHLKACITRIWKPSCSLEIHLRENGFFFFKFGDEQKCDRVLQTRPWLFDGRLIVLKKWTEKTCLDGDLLSSVPIWVQFPSLHLKLWPKAIISWIASIVGTPIHMDRSTGNGERLSCARSFIEVSAAKPLPKSINLQVEEGEEIEVDITYE